MNQTIQQMATRKMFVHAFPGCQPTPLASYLKALGILRLLTEQKDRSCRGYWKNDIFHLMTELNESQIVHFFLYEYEPTPIIAPWNGGSGFFKKDNQKALKAILNSKTKRFEKYKNIIQMAIGILYELNIKEKPDESLKIELLRTLRSRMPDEFVRWFDAAVQIIEDDTRYPPLLGTGGNDGRLEFTNNYMQRLITLIDISSGQPAPEAYLWLQHALWLEGTPPLLPNAIGQFSPGHVGGPNATTGFDRDSLSNPWDFVLMIEGALLFAGATTRRLETTEPGALSYPFTVKPAAVGHGSIHTADETESRAEFWVPIWKNPASLLEIQTLLSEGRATVGRRPVIHGLDFVRAVAHLGVDRGVDKFQRFAFLKRSGKAYLATPLGQIKVSPNIQSALLIDDLDKNNFLHRLHQIAGDKETPGQIKTLISQLEQRIYRLTRYTLLPYELQEILIILGQLECAFYLSKKMKDSISPVPSLNSQWMLKADDASDEFRIASAIASLNHKIPFRVHISGVLPSTAHKWSEATSHTTAWFRGDLISNLKFILTRRLLNTEEKNTEFGSQQKHHDIPLNGSLPVDIHAIFRFLRGELNDRRIFRLIPGLSLIQLPEHLPPRKPKTTLVTADYVILRILFTPFHSLLRIGLIQPDQRPPRIGRTVALLKAGRLRDALHTAWHELRVSGILNHRIFPKPPVPELYHPHRVLASMLIPLKEDDLRAFSSIYLKTSKPYSS